MISSGFFREARIGDRVVISGNDPWIVVQNDDGYVRAYSIGFGDCPSISPSCTRDGIEVVGWGDGWAISKLDEQIDGHQVWKLWTRGSDQEGDEE